MNKEEIREQADGSITDPEIIRQIAILGDIDLYDKVRPGFEYAGLYPHVMIPHNIKPERKGPPIELQTEEAKQEGEKARKLFNNIIGEISDEEKENNKQILELRLFLLDNITSSNFKEMLENTYLDKEEYTDIINFQIFNPDINTLSKIIKIINFLNKK